MRRHHERRLAGVAAAPLAAVRLPSQVGVADLAYGLYQLVPHGASRVVAHAELAHQVYRGDAVLCPRDQVDGEEPSAQRELGVVQQRAGRERQLVLAADALEELAGAQLTVPLIAAFAAGKALRPACLEQRFLALRLGPVQAQEFR